MTKIKNVCLHIKRGTKVLAIARKKDPQKLGMAGGKVDPGETPEEAARREGGEELGAPVELGELLYVGEDETGDITATYDATIVGEFPATPFVGPEGTVISDEDWSVLTDPSRCEFAEYNRAVQNSL